MPLHLLKLCVGVDSIRDLESWIAERLSGMRERGEKPERFHTTRMAPKRAAELLDGGSLYWVIRGQIAARETLLDIRPFTDAEGVHRCKLVLDSRVVPVMPRPYRAFQGWRYLVAHEAPADFGASAADIADMPETLRRELRELGLLY